MRKNVTQNEWCKIYRHCRPKLKDSTRARGDLKLKRTRKKTEVIVRNRTYTWDKAWKNMKNAGAIAQLLNRDGQLVGIYFSAVVLGADMVSVQDLSAHFLRIS